MRQGQSLPENHNGCVYVRGLVPLSLENRLRAVCAHARYHTQDDYGHTFRTVIALGVERLEQMRDEVR